MGKTRMLAAAIACALIAGFASAAATAPARWVVVDLGTLGGRASTPYAINDRGWVVGEAETRAGDVVGPISHAFLWADGRMRDLGTLGGRFSLASAINDRGQVVGSAHTGKKDSSGFPVSHAFLWQDGRMRDLGAFEPITINERGQVLGTTNGDALFGRLLLWESGRLRRLGALGQGRWGYAIGNGPGPRPLNGRGQVVGQARGAAVLWEDGRLRALGGGWARSINDRGQVIGNSSGHAFLWQRGRMVDLTPSAVTSTALAINARGQVVASVRRQRVWRKEYALVWHEGRSTYLPSRGRWGATPTAINDRGQVVGRTGDVEDSARATLWTLRRG